MAKAKTSKKPRRSKRKLLTPHESFASPELKNANGVIETLLDCIKDGDIQTFREVLAAHLMTVNKVHLAQKAGIGRRTIYDLLDPKKEFNPELTTITALFQALRAD